MKKEIEFSVETSSNASIRYVSVEENSNKEHIKAIEFLENLYLSFIKTVDIQSSKKFIEFVDVQSLPNKNYISYVEVISRLEPYVRARILNDKTPLFDQIIIQKQFTRLFPEIIDLVELCVKEINKGAFNDQYSLTDNLEFSWGKLILDIFSHQEERYFEISKFLQQIVILSEETKKGFAKTRNTQFNISDQRTWHLSKEITEIFSIEETTSFNFWKRTHDSFKLKDRVNIFSHNYTNTGTYTSENYVGQNFIV